MIVMYRLQREGGGWYTDAMQLKSTFNPLYCLLLSLIVVTVSTVALSLTTPAPIPTCIILNECITSTANWCHLKNVGGATD
jgi:hypothetical protein